MERRKTIFDFLAQVLCIFGFTMLLLSLFCLLFGASARGYSSIFALGAEGIPIAVAWEYLLLSVCIAGARYLFFTDRIIRQMALWLRTALMLGTVLLLLVLFILAFDWFPVNHWRPWALFLLCFGLSFVGSLLVMALKERLENRQLEAALRRMQEKGGDKNGCGH